ncbi:PIG-L family deacetylase [Terrimonas sp. NA20]|uniref:PIG-L family deacetylase n=1 Tax=Terrimonas ginsenosidimutans TaxID=2908004 RepID=A0ABS9KYB0_9BACT|nr:PIG-L family deacetylase [Terrimonas ginsenosidimutans]MCG2617298.1 PIG-L family deacetylase [Terrimonas ginsenosidimutans]
MKKAQSLIAIFFLLFASVVKAQSYPTWTSAEMYQALRKLNVLGSVLYVAAHPDDENTRLITYLSKDRLYRTGYLSMTRGDGGQNLIGNEQGIELGLIRTQELLAARRVDGGEQFFTRAYDFGFSKNPEETFTKWDKEKILSDVVWVIRNFQPDIVITRFPTTGEGGHGHHTASAILANEAFKAAADPSRFPEQLKWVKPWQARCVLFNSFNFGGNNTITDDQLKVDVGGYNPLLGKSYGEIAAESRSQHKSQGFGVPASRGESYESFKTTAGTSPSKDIMDGIDLSWKRIEGGDKVAVSIDAITQSFDLLHPERSVPGLVKLYQQISGLKDGYWKAQKLKEVKELIAQCSGLFLEATTTEQFSVQTDSLRINMAFNNRQGVQAVLQTVNITDAFDSTLKVTLPKNRNIAFSRKLYVPVSNNITQPYWLANKMEEGYFNVNDQQLIGQPDVQPSYKMIALISIEGQDFRFERPVKYKFTDPVKGELYEPVVIVPKVLVSVDPPTVIRTAKETPEFAVTLKANKRMAAAPDARIELEAKLKPAVLRTGLPLLEKDYVVGYEAKVQDTISSDYRGVSVVTGGEVYNQGLRSIHYDHIPFIAYYKAAVLQTSFVDLKIVNKRIGYIVGAGDKVPASLEQMGYEVVMLGDKELSRINLQQFDAIISGVRAYNTNEWLNAYYDKLMKYVQEGGNLIVQYNTSSNVGPVKAKIGPYPFNISRTRVTDEKAEVTFVKPDHPVLNYPNKITQQDFAGWIQERSIYHGSDWDKNFETILTMHDPGEKADAGSLLIAKYGKGYFTYTGIVFFRELPAGVPGAYRLLANIIGLNRKKAF